MKLHTVTKLFVGAGVLYIALALAYNSSPFPLMHVVGAAPLFFYAAVVELLARILTTLQARERKSDE